MKYYLVPGRLWEGWLEKESERWPTLESNLGSLNFFGKRYDDRFELTVATRRKGREVIGVAAFCALNSTRSDTGNKKLEVHELVAIGVHRDFRGHGVGRKLLHRFSRRGVRITSRPSAVVIRNWFSDALGFYESVGFHRRSIATRQTREWMESASDQGVLFWQYR